ncbi:MAG: NUDIX domain-containing protein, partial [Pseudomonadota bacterium]
MSALKPQIGVSIAVTHETNGSFLLVKRGNAPSKGKWAFPGGRLNFGEL